MNHESRIARSAFRHLRERGFLYMPEGYWGFHAGNPPKHRDFDALEVLVEFNDHEPEFVELFPEAFNKRH